MGIKDWLGGDKKKEAFREEAKEALAKVTPGRVDELIKAARKHNVENPADDKTQLRRDVFNKAAGAVRAQGHLSSREIEELAKIQKFLALRDDQVERTKWDLVRLRTLTEIRQGNLPTVSPSSSSLRGVQLEPDEIAHYSLGVDMLDLSSTRGADGVPVRWNKPYDSGSARVHGLPEAGAKPVGEGSLIITNRRLVLKIGTRTASVKYGPDAQIHLYSDGIRLQKTIGNSLLKFRSGSDETGEIVGELLAALMKPELT